MQLTELFNCYIVSLPVRPCFFGFSTVAVIVCDYLLLQIFKLFLANDTYRLFVLDISLVLMFGL